jgi:hypothetical protein
MARLKRLSVCLLAIPCCLLVSCAGGGESARDASLTAEFRAFLAARGSEASDVVEVESDGYRCRLEDGRLCVFGAEGAALWCSKDEWYVDSFKIGDVNRDPVPDIAFVVWKSYSFGADRPARAENDDPAVRCHLFVYSIKDDRVKPLWCSSNLPRPIYAFALRADGEQTPVLSGVRLLTREGTYTEDYGKTASTAYEYAWSGRGFSPVVGGEAIS